MNDEDFAEKLAALGLEYTLIAEGEFRVYASAEAEAEHIREQLIEVTPPAPLDGPMYEFTIEPFDGVFHSHAVQVVTPWCPWWSAEDEEVNDAEIR